MKINYGDIIGVKRLGGIYEHYGVFENVSRIYEYSSRNKPFGIPDIHTTTLSSFIGDSGSCFILIFPPKYGRPEKKEIPVSFHRDSKAVSAFSAINHAENEAAYHLYSPEETIMRAKSKLGETEYSLFFNNCEHFAIWCKTGIHHSFQVENLLNLTRKIIVAADIFGQVQ